MIGLDTSVLARYYIDDSTDTQAQHQREAARRLIESGQPLMVCKTVLLELEWVMRGYYGFEPSESIAVLRHLLGLAQVSVEDRATVELALSSADAGLDLADALHHASYRVCSKVASFDDRKFARRVQKMGLAPAVTLLT